MNRILVLVAMVFAPLAVHAQGFIFGVATGVVLGSNNNSSSAGSATIIYTAKDDILKTVDPMQVKMVASSLTCFNNTDGNAVKNLGELFNDLMQKRGNPHQRTVLQIVRVFSGTSTDCASIWFSYLEK